MRDRPRRILLALTALLMAVQFFGPTTPLASAHGVHSTVQGSLGESVTDEVANCRADAKPEDVGGSLPSRDRHRTATDPLPCIMRWSEPAAASPPAGPALSSSASRYPATPSLTSLQVFRC